MARKKTATQEIPPEVGEIEETGALEKAPEATEEWVVELPAFLHIGGPEKFREVVVIGKTEEGNIIIRGAGGDEVVPWHRLYTAGVDVGGGKKHYPKFNYEKALAAEVSGSA